MGIRDWGLVLRLLRTNAILHNHQPLTPIPHPLTPNPRPLTPIPLFSLRAAACRYVEDHSEGQHDTFDDILRVAAGAHQVHAVGQ